MVRLTNCLLSILTITTFSLCINIYSNSPTTVNNAEAALETAIGVQQSPELSQNDLKQNPSKYMIVTENYPPYSYISKGKITGIATEIIEEILNRLEMQNTKIELLKWDEAYTKTLNSPNTILYSVVKLKSRENKFKWCGPIATNYWFLFAKKQVNNINIKTLNEAKNYNIGVLDKGALCIYLQDKGFTKLKKYSTNLDSAKQLIEGKIQLWGISEMPAFYIMKQIKKPPTLLEKVYTLRKENLYIAFNKNIPDKLIENFNNALNQMKNDGSYDKIMDKYYSDFYTNAVEF